MTDNLQYIDDFFLQQTRHSSQEYGYEFEDDDSREAEISDSVTISGVGEVAQKNATAMSMTRGSTICPSKYFTEDSGSYERHMEDSVIDFLPEVTSPTAPYSGANTCTNTMATYVHNTPREFGDEDDDMKHMLPCDEIPHVINSRDHILVRHEKEKEVLCDKTMETVNYSDDDSLWSLEVDVEKLFRKSRQGCVGRECRELCATMPYNDRFPPNSIAETKMRKEALKIAQLLCMKPSSNLKKKKIGEYESTGDLTASTTPVKQINHIEQMRNIRETIAEELKKQDEQHMKMIKEDKTKGQNNKEISAHRPQVASKDTFKSLPTVEPKSINEALNTIQYPQHDIVVNSISMKSKIIANLSEEPKRNPVTESINEKLKMVTKATKYRASRSHSPHALFGRNNRKPKIKSSGDAKNTILKSGRSVSEGKIQEQRKAAAIRKEKSKAVHKTQNLRTSREPTKIKSPQRKKGKSMSKSKGQGDSRELPVNKPKPRKLSNNLSRDKEKTNLGKSKVSEKEKQKPKFKPVSNTILRQNNAKKTNDKSKPSVHFQKNQKPVPKQNVSKVKSSAKPTVNPDVKPKVVKKPPESKNKSNSSPNKFATNAKKSQMSAIRNSSQRLTGAGDGNKKERMRTLTAPSHRAPPEKTSRPDAVTKVMKELRPATQVTKPPVPISRPVIRRDAISKPAKVIDRSPKKAEIKKLEVKKLEAKRTDIKANVKPWLPGKVKKEPVKKRDLRLPPPVLPSNKKSMALARGKSFDEMRRQKLRQLAVLKPVDRRVKPKPKSEPRVRLSIVKTPPASQRPRTTVVQRTFTAISEKGDFSFSSDDYAMTPMFVTPFTLKECYEILQKQTRHSYTREVLTSEIVALYNGQRTKLGCELVHCIAANVHDPSDRCPRIPDSKCIDKFQSFFYPLLFKLFRKTYSKIEDIFRQPELKTAVSSDSHLRARSLQLMPLRWQSLPSNYLQKYRFLKNYVVSIDIEIRRNIEGYRIGEAMRLEERHDLQLRLTKALFDFDNDGALACLDNAQVIDLKKNLRKYLRFNGSKLDAGLSAPSPLGQSVYSSMAHELENNSHVIVWMNVDDHIQIATLNENFDRINHVFSSLNNCSTVILDNLGTKPNRMRKSSPDIRSEFTTPTGNTFMTHPIFGYITNNPKHLGTGCQLRFLVRIPLIGHLPNIDDVTSDFIDLKAVPFDLERPDREVFYLFSECCFDDSEAAMITTVTDRTAALLRVEKAMKKCNPRFPEDVSMPVEPLRYLYRKINNNIFERTSGLRPLTWKCLNSSIVEQSISLFTSYGGSLAHCIRHNAYHPSETLPRACDAEVYSIFSEFFDRILSEANEGETNAASFNPVEDLRKANVTAMEFDHPRVLYFQLQFVRNVEGFAFSPIISATSRRLVEMKLLSHLIPLKNDLMGSYCSMKELTNDCESTLNALQTESVGEIRQEIFAINTDSVANKCVGCYRNWPSSRGVYYLTQRPQDTDTTIWINTTDHFQLVTVSKQLSNAYSVCHQILHQLHQANPYLFARTPDKGYLTFCPNEVGHGMRVSARVNLPFLAKKMELFKQLCQKQQLEVQPVLAESDYVTFDIHHTAKIGKSNIESATQFLHNLKELIHLDHSFEMLETI